MKRLTLNQGVSLKKFKKNTYHKFFNNISTKKDSFVK